MANDFRDSVTLIPLTPHSAVFRRAALCSIVMSSLILGACGSGGEEGSADSSSNFPTPTLSPVPAPTPAPTPSPAPLPPAYACASLPGTQVIGNWDMVPQQLISGPTRVGVVAFHEEGVDVVFRLGSTQLARVTDPTYNPDTGVWEYWFNFDPVAAGTADGPINLRATVEPDCPGHQSRELVSLPLLANGGGSLSNTNQAYVDCATGNDTTGNGASSLPYASIEKGLHAVGDGGTVLVKAGTCTLTNTRSGRSPQQWTTIQPAPGVARDQVRIYTTSTTYPSSTDRFAENLVRWKNVTLVEDSGTGFSRVLYLESNHQVWLDGTDISDAKGRFSGGELVGGGIGHRAYFTGCNIHDIQSTLGLTFGRNNTLKNIGSDVFRATSNLVAINTHIDTIDKGTTSAHPDLFQLYSPGSTVENQIIYGLSAFNMGAQGIFNGSNAGGIKDIAFVNVATQQTASNGYLSQVSGAWDHVLLFHVTMDNQPFHINNADAVYPSNWVIQNSVFDVLTAPAMIGTIRYNHVARLNWDQPTPPGSPVSVGDPLFVDVANHDLRLQRTSPAAGAGKPIPGVPVDIRGIAWDMAAPDMGAYSGL